MIFLDLETRSRVDIKDVGGQAYVRHPSTELLCGVVAHVREGRLVVVPYGPSELMEGLPKWQCLPSTLETLGLTESVVWGTPMVTDRWLPVWVEKLAAAGETLVAHNAEGFDRPALEHRGLWGGYEWIDSAHRARQSGLPAGLDAIGESLYGLGKDKKAVKVLQLSYKPHKKTGQFLEPNEGRLSTIVRYCARDVLLMVAAWRDEGWGNAHPDDEVRKVHITMDRRGLCADLELAKMLEDESEKLKAEALAKAADVGAAPEVISSPQQLGKWLAGHGVAVPNVQKNTLLLALEEDIPEECKIVISARLACNRVTKGKAVAAQKLVCPDGRLRGTTRYWGAVTGRWSGAGYQVQNLTAPVKGFSEAAYDKGIPAVAAELKVSKEDILGSMLRGVILAEPGRWLAMEDYSQIEARVLPWLARDEATLDVFREGRDIYRMAAARIYGRSYEDIHEDSLERKVGKVATLALGYQGGPGALLSMAKLMKLDLEAEGIDPEVVVNAWRDANTLIAGKRKGVWKTPEGKNVITREGGLWKDARDAAKAAVEGQPSEAARCHFAMRGAHLLITLPSGRPLVYRNARWEPHEDSWGGVTNAVVFDSVRYGKIVREATYGGRLVENITQAVARDVMAEAMIELERVGLRPLFTVHDEIICSVEKGGEAQVVEIMERTPAWAGGLPLKAEGTIGKRYGK